MSAFIDQTHISKENPSARHKNNILKQKVKASGKGGGLKARKPLGQINANVGTTLKHIQNENNVAKKQQQHPKKVFRKPFSVISRNSINVNKKNVPNVEAWPKSIQKPVDYFPYAQKPSAKTFLNNLTKCNNNNNKHSTVVEIDHEETKHLIFSDFDDTENSLSSSKTVVADSSNKKGGLLCSLIDDMGDEDLSDLSSLGDSSDDDD
jgi:hypothetical protein